jgi:hypothetical protein
LRIVGRIVLFGLAAVGLGTCAVLFLSWWMGPGDPLDRTRVVAVVPNASGREAAVLYLHHIANYSADVLALRLSQPPFPKVGSNVALGSHVIAIQHPLVAGWRTSAGQAATDFREVLAVSWKGDALDLCPAKEAKVVTFDAHAFSQDFDKVTLCAASAKQVLQRP